MSTPEVPVLCQAGMAILALFMPLAIAWGIVPFLPALPVWTARANSLKCRPSASKSSVRIVSSGS
ncbi:hypothetical protein [Paracidovorax avenae]|uniref:hypothetical protein n=1 Tax=Paracidovorax avenae TaxID=80867 RepID=UPI001AD8498D|nr:hypothetical protein [Paracidovorax avenae]